MPQAGGDGSQWLAALPLSDRKLLVTPGLSLRDIWVRMTEAGKNVVRAMVRAGQKELAAHQDKLDEWTIANYVRLPDGKLERKPKEQKPKPKTSYFD